MEYNLVGNGSKFAKIAQLMGENIEGLSEMDAAQKSVGVVRRLAQILGMPQKLRDVGIKSEDIPGFVDYLFKFQLYGIENNARNLTREDAAKVFRAAL
jgi:1,3-propanediol dehydrogenase